MLGLDFENDYKHMDFPVSGTLHEVGATVAGSTSFLPMQIWDQDNSIMGFTSGFGIASAHDLAKFYWDYLGPDHYVTSDAMLKEAYTFGPMDRGWEGGNFNYGGGLMFMHSNHNEAKPFNLNMTTTYIGHEGITYGFHSRTGYYAVPGFAMSVIVNNDWDKSYPSTVQCHITQIILKHKGFPKSEYELGCG